MSVGINFAEYNNDWPQDLDMLLKWAFDNTTLLGSLQLCMRGVRSGSSLRHLVVCKGLTGGKAVTP